MPQSVFTGLRGGWTVFTFVLSRVRRCLPCLPRVFTSGVYLRVPNLCLCCGTRASMESVFATVFPMHFPGASVYHQIGDSTWNLEYEVQMAIVDRLPVLAKRARGFADCLSNCTGCLMRWTLAHLFARETPRALLVRRQ